MRIFNFSRNLLLCALGLLFCWGCGEPVPPALATTISVSWPGAQANDVAEIVVGALESEIRSLKGVKTIQSIAENGRGTLRVWFEPGENPEKMRDQIANALDKQAGRLPQDMEEPIIFSHTNFEGEELAIFDFSFTENRENNFLKRDLVSYLESISGIEVVGFEATAPGIEIIPDGEKLKAFGLSYQEIVSGIVQSGISVSRSIEDLGEIYIQSAPEPVSVAELATIEVKEAPPGTVIRVFAQKSDSLEALRNAVREKYQAFASSHGFQPHETVFWPVGGGEMRQILVVTEKEELNEVLSKVLSAHRFEKSAILPISSNEPEIQLNFDRNGLAMVGAMGGIAKITAQIRPQNAGTVAYNGADAPVTIMPWRDPSDIGELQIFLEDRNNGKKMAIPLGAIAEVSLSSTGTVFRSDGNRVFRLFIQPKPGFSSAEALAEVKAVMQEQAQISDENILVNQNELWFPESSHSEVSNSRHVVWENE